MKITRDLEFAPMRYNANQPAKESPSIGSERRLVLPLRVLRLTLKRQWFDMIASGVKLEEYRQPSRWILSRLEGKQYDQIEFKNGYGPNVPTIVVQYLDWSYGYGRREWGGGSTPGQPLIVINFGDIISLQNVLAEPWRAAD